MKIIKNLDASIVYTFLIHWETRMLKVKIIFISGINIVQHKIWFKKSQLFITKVIKENTNCE